MTSAHTQVTSEVEQQRNHILQHEPDGGEPRRCLKQHIADLEAAVRVEERDRITDQLDEWGSEIHDFYPGADYELQQAAKAVLHDAAKRLYEERVS